MVEKAESVQAGTEGEGNPASEGEKDFLSISGTTPGEISAPEDEPKGEEKTPEEEKAEQEKVSFEKRVKAEAYKQAQAMTDKQMKSTYSKIAEMEKQVSEWRTKAEAKEDEADLNAMFKGDMEDDGETVARRRDAARRKFLANYRDYEAHKSEVEKAKKEWEEYATVRGKIERHQNAREEALKLLLPDSEEVVSQVEAIIQRLEEAESPREFALILQAIKNERTGKPVIKGHKPAATPSSVAGKRSIFYVDEIEDPAFFAKHEAEILTAYEEGRVKRR